MSVRSSFRGLPPEGHALIPQLQLALAAALDKKAENSVVLDLRGLASFTDWFLICTGSSTRQVQAIVDEVESRLKSGMKARARIEGYDKADWVLMDFFDFVVHVFTPEKREFYQLEHLWGDAPHLEGTDLASKKAAKQVAKQSARPRAKAPAKRAAKPTPSAAAKPAARPRRATRAKS